MDTDILVFFHRLAAALVDLGTVVDDSRAVLRMLAAESLSVYVYPR